jgi:IclR helix-turn-helix domain
MNTDADIRHMDSRLGASSRSRRPDGESHPRGEVGEGTVGYSTEPHPEMSSMPTGVADGGAGGGPSAERIVIELSPAQVDRVVRGAAESGNMSVLLSGLDDVREVLAREPRQLEDSRLSRSLLAGLLMLASFPTDGSYLGNAEIARMLDMNPSTTHRYVSTLVAVGLLERDPATRRYRLV